MSISIIELERLNDYQFTLRSYQDSHSVLTLSAIDPKDTSSRFNVHFVDVHYIKMPLGWIGRFENGSDLEREEIAKKVGLSSRGAAEVMLYKSNQGEVLILGVLMHIEPRGPDK